MNSPYCANSKCKNCVLKDPLVRNNHYILEYVKSKNHFFLNLTLILFVAINLLALVFYKYSFWLVNLLHDNGIADNITAKPQILPLGISFFTFHAISYLIDISRGELNGKSNVVTDNDQ